MLREVGEHVGRVEKLDKGHPGGDINTVYIIAKHQGTASRVTNIELLTNSQQRSDLNMVDD